MHKILFYTDTPLLGGAENQMLLLARFLPKDRFSVTVACGNFQKLNPWCQKLLENNINVVRFKIMHKHDPRQYFYLKKLLPQFDLLHLHVWNPGSGRYGLLAATKIPLVITEHDPFKLSGLKAWLKNKFFTRVNSIIVASYASKKAVLEQNQNLDSKIVVIPNGIDIEEWKRACILPNRNEYRRIHFSALPQDRVILCVAELHERKGQKHLISAMKQVATKFPHAKLILVGDGIARKKYEKEGTALETSFRILGHRRDIAHLMAASDIFVLPSVREAFGLVLLEATLAELPIVASRVGGIPEIIEDGKSGLLVEPGNPEKLAAAIEKMLINPQEAKMLCENAKEKVEREYHAEKMAERTSEVYAKIL